MTGSGSADLSVAQVVDSLARGGMERTVVDLANGLTRTGWRSHVLCTRVPGPLRDALVPDVNLYCAERTSRWDLGGIRRIAEFLDDGGIDVVHTHTHYSAYLLRLALRWAKSRPIHVAHDQHGMALHRRLMRLYDWLMLRKVDAYVAVSAPLRDRARKLLSLPDDRCLLLPNGVEVSPAREPFAGPPTVIQVANLRHPKGHDTAVRAAAIVRRDVPDLRWICVGKIADQEAEYVSMVRRLIHELGLGDCVELVGERSQVRPMLRQAHVGVLTSDAEAFPVSLLEYMAEQLPVVVTEVGQSPPVIHQAGCGRVVPPRDPERTAEALVEILGDGDQARTMGEAGREFAGRELSLDAMVEKVLALYRRLLERRRA